MSGNYVPGQGCQCHAHSEAECGCDVDWTPREVYELREQRDRITTIARELIAMIRINVMVGRFAECTVEQIDEHLKPWIDKIAAVKGGSHE